MIQEKIEYVLDLVRFERQVPKKFYKLIENTDGIWEVRVITTFKSIRLFSGMVFLQNTHLFVRQLFMSFSLNKRVSRGIFRACSPAFKCHFLRCFYWFMMHNTCMWQ
jgi:hypothetical protein